MQDNNRFLGVLSRRSPVLMDGGLATQLEAQGCDINDALWSAGLLLDDPDQVVAAHRAFVDAGAEIIATVTYQASREGFGQRGISAADADKLMLQSVDLAVAAADSDTIVAASLGPYGAILHDGSEYHGNYGVSDDHLREFHASRIDLLRSSDADVLAFETIPSLQEARVLAELLQDVALPAWVSFSCRDGLSLSDGTAVSEASSLFSSHPVVAAVGVNCTSPQYVPGVIAELRKGAPDKAILAYPNSGETWNADDGKWYGTATPIDYAAAAVSWVESGATLVGGCCRTGPDHIRAMANALGK